MIISTHYQTVLLISIKHVDFSVVFFVCKGVYNKNEIAYCWLECFWFYCWRFKHTSIRITHFRKSVRYFMMSVQDSLCLSCKYSYFIRKSAVYLNVEVLLDSFVVFLQAIVVNLAIKPVFNFFTFLSKDYYKDMKVSFRYYFNFWGFYVETCFQSRNATKVSAKHFTSLNWYFI